LTRITKLYERLLANPNAATSYRDLGALHVAFGFEMHPGKGSHTNYKHPDVPFILTIHPRGKDAVPYQVKRLLAVVEEYHLHIRP